MNKLIGCSIAASLLGFAFAAAEVQAFPETIRHKYNNCSTCHVSPTGGGLISDYGRALSLEAMSMGGSEKEAEFAYGALKLPDWFKLGADFRSIQTYRDTPGFKEGRFFLMQADVHTAIVTPKFTALFSGGREYIRTGPTSNRAEAVSRDHWLMVTPIEKYSVRAGRFRPAWGNNNPEHFVSTRRGLGWDENTETYNVELAFVGEELNVFLTGVGGRLDKDELDTDKGASATGSYTIKGRYKVGLSLFQGIRTEAKTSRRIVAPWFNLGITEDLYIMGEHNSIQTFAEDDYSGDVRAGYAGYYKQGYDIKRGLTIYLLEDLSDSDTKSKEKDFEAYGLGLQVMPRPHLEFNLQYQKQKIAAFGDDKWSDFGFFLAHFYL